MPLETADEIADTVAALATAIRDGDQQRAAECAAALLDTLLNDLRRIADAITLIAERNDHD